MTTQTISPVTEAFLMEAAGTDVSTQIIWISRILSWAAVLFLHMDGGMKLFKPPVVVQATVQLGYPSPWVSAWYCSSVCSLYVIPRTTTLGALLLTGYLGGAMARNLRAATPLFNTAFPFLFAVLIWASLVLRSRRLESILFHGE